MDFGTGMGTRPSTLGNFPIRDASGLVVTFAVRSVRSLEFIH